jgi:hypothetical protein
MIRDLSFVGALACYGVADLAALRIWRRVRRAGESAYVHGVVHGILWMMAKSGEAVFMEIPAAAISSAKEIAAIDGRGFQADPHACPGPAVCACVYLPRATWVDITLDPVP